MRKVIFTIVLAVVVVFLPLSVSASSVSGESGDAISGCNKKGMSAKARRACRAKARARAAARKKRRAEEARLRAIARANAIENNLRKTATNNILRDNIEGEDLAVRQVALEALGSHAGTVIVMETKTGKILTAVNHNWAFRKAFEPCSTIKLVTTVAGLKEEVIDEEDEESQSALEQALARSNNRYFQRVGSHMEYPEMIQTAKELGLGKPTGINVPGEIAGQIPLVKKTALVYSHGYGFKTTPLQQAVLISTIANHGKKVVPYIPRDNYNPQSSMAKSKIVDLPVKDLDGVIPGIKGAAEYGTARRGVDADLGVAGKTGTCSKTGTFTSVAPIDDPKYTVVVVLRGRYGKGRYAAAVAGKIYEALLSQPAEPDSDNRVIPAMLKMPEAIASHP